MQNYAPDNNNNTALLPASRFLSPIYNAHESSIDETITNEHLQLNGLSEETGLNQTANSLLNNSHHPSSVSPLDCQQSQISYLEHLNSTNLNDQTKLDKSVDEYRVLSPKLSSLSDQPAKVKLEHNESINLEQQLEYFHQNV